MLTFAQRIPIKSASISFRNCSFHGGHQDFRWIRFFATTFFKPALPRIFGAYHWPCYTKCGLAVQKLKPWYLYQSGDSVIMNPNHDKLIWIICLYSIGWTQHVNFSYVMISQSHIISSYIIIFCKSITDIRYPAFFFSSGFLRLQYGPVPDMASFGNVMTALAKGGGHWCQASALLDTMASQRIIGNVIIYSAFLSACEMAGYLWRTKKRGKGCSRIASCRAGSEY